MTHPNDADSFLFRVLRAGVGVHLRAHGPRHQRPPGRHRRRTQPPQENHPQISQSDLSLYGNTDEEVSCQFHDCLPNETVTGLGVKCIQLFAPIFVCNMNDTNTIPKLDMANGKEIFGNHTWSYPKRQQRLYQSTNNSFSISSQMTYDWQKKTQVR